MKEKKRGPGRPREAMSRKPIGKRVSALKARGLSFTQIGERLGVSRQRAHHIYMRLLAEQAA